jgi:hypothetical protein
MGIPTAVICTDQFESVARTTAVGLGMPDAGIVVIQHPIVEVPTEELDARVDTVMTQIVAHLTQPQT